MTVLNSTEAVIPRVPRGIPLVEAGISSFNEIPAFAGMTDIGEAG